MNDAIRLEQNQTKDQHDKQKYNTKSGMGLALGGLVIGAAVSVGCTIFSDELKDLRVYFPNGTYQENTENMMSELIQKLEEKGNYPKTLEQLKSLSRTIEVTDDSPARNKEASEALEKILIEWYDREMENARRKEISPQPKKFLSWFRK